MWDALGRSANEGSKGDANEPICRSNEGRNRIPARALGHHDLVAARTTRFCGRSSTGIFSWLYVIYYWVRY